MEHEMIGGQEPLEEHENDDTVYGNKYVDKEEYLKAFESKVLKDYPDFDKIILDQFRKFFNSWEKELESIEQVSAQTAHKRLIKYLKV